MWVSILCTVRNAGIKKHLKTVSQILRAPPTGYTESVHGFVVLLFILLGTHAHTKSSDAGMNCRGDRG